MKCFEINLLLQDHGVKEYKDIRQYFQQENGAFQAVQNTLAWVHLQVNRIKAKHSETVIERLILWQWEIATPLPSGEIGTKKYKDRVLDWSFERGLINIHQNLSNKQKRKVSAAIRYLNKYRHVRAEISIEEIGRELMEGITCIATL